MQHVIYKYLIDTKGTQLLQLDLSSYTLCYIGNIHRTIRVFISIALIYVIYDLSLTKTPLTEIKENLNENIIPLSKLYTWRVHLNPPSFDHNTFSRSWNSRYYVGRFLDRNRNSRKSIRAKYSIKFCNNKYNGRGHK